MDSSSEHPQPGARFSRIAIARIAAFGTTLGVAVPIQSA
jgi:hypothetical protein